MNVVKYLGHGIGRAVCKLENGIVIKVPFNGNGVKQNRSEKLKYENNPTWFAKVIDYNVEKDFLYMEYISDKSEYFQDYQRDNVHCEVYDELTFPLPKCECNGKCYLCNHNVLSNLIPENIDEIIENKPKDKIQVGINAEQEYKYFDYANIQELDPQDLKFYDSWADYAIEYLTLEPEQSFEDFLKTKDLSQCEDYSDKRLTLKKSRIAWTKWNNREE